MKKVLKSFFIVAFMIISFNVNAFNSQEYSFKDELPVGWTTEVYNSYSDVTLSAYNGEDALGIICDTSLTASGAITKAQVYTDELSVDDLFVLSFRMAVNESVSGVKRTIKINNSTQSLDLITISESELSCAEETVAVPINSYFNLDVAFDNENGEIFVWLDSEYCFTVEGLGSGFDFTNAYLEFWNGFVNKKTLSEWYISSYKTASELDYKPTAMPFDGSSYVDISSFEGIQIDFGTIIPNLQNKNIQLQSADIDTETYLEESFEIEGNEQCIIIKPSEGLTPMKEYKVCISDVTDVFNTIHGEYNFSFSTAPAGYVPPSCEINYPSNDTVAIYTGDTVNVDLDITVGSYDIIKVELYNNTELIQTKTSDFNFSFSAQQGENAIYVKIYDEALGNALSNTVTFNAKVNNPPLIYFSYNSSTRLAIGDEIIIDATDSDGTISSVVVYFNNETVITQNSGSAVFVIPDDVWFGEHTVSVMATDNRGLETKKQIIVEIAEYRIATKLNASFSGFDDYLTTSAKTIAANITACANATATSKHYITNKTIDTEHGNSVILGSEGKTSGATAWLGVNSFSDANRPTGIAIFNTNLYVSSNHTTTNIFLKTLDTEKWVYFLRFVNSKIYYDDGVTVYDMDLETEKWYEISIEINLENSTYNLYINDETIVEGYSFSTEVNSIYCLRIEMRNNTEEPAYVATSKFEVYDKFSYPYFTGVDFTGNSVPTTALNADTFVYKLDNLMDTELFIPNELTLYSDGDVIDFDIYEVIDDEIYINLLYPVEENFDYKLVLNFSYENNEYNSVYCFQSDIREKGVTEYEFNISNGMVQFVAEAVNNGTDDNILCILAKYNNNIMVDMVYKEIQLMAGNNEISSGLMGYDDNDNTTYEAFIWESWTNRLSINNKYYKH